MQHERNSRAKLYRSMTSIAVIMVVFVVGYTMGQRKTAVVRAQWESKPGVRSLNIPEAWGHCIGSLAGNLIFEDSSGVIRIFDVDFNQGLKEQISRN